MRDFPSVIISGVCCFQTSDTVFPKDLFSDYLDENAQIQVSSETPEIVFMTIL